MTIELSAYNPVWIKMFEEERQLLLSGFPITACLIEHIGSTAVPDIKAKPIIDIMIGISSLPDDINTIVNYLKQLSYEYIDQYNLIISERRFFQKETNGKRTHHIHLVSFHSDFWERHLFFRNQLRENSIIRQQYEKLKTSLAQQQWNSGNDYADAKSDFIKSIDKQRQANS